MTKQAIALNVSRSEILRKTCPVWKAIAKVFGPLADKVSGSWVDAARQKHVERDQHFRCSAVQLMWAKYSAMKKSSRCCQANGISP
nr:hypothetical protein pPsy0479a_00017 [Pseudomonas syringae]